MATDFDGACDDGGRSVGGGAAAAVWRAAHIPYSLVRSGAGHDDRHPCWEASLGASDRGGKGKVLQQRRWCCEVEVRNRHGYGASFSKGEVSMELVPNGSQGGGCYPQVVESASSGAGRQGCSLSEGSRRQR